MYSESASLLKQCPHASSTPLSAVCTSISIGQMWPAFPSHERSHSASGYGKQMADGFMEQTKLCV
jgi:hypothetical protein